jgi:AcrR family transcriptional regulator
VSRSEEGVATESLPDWERSRRGAFLRVGLGEQREPRTLKGRRTRAALVQAAREVFEEQGFLDARISDIAKTAGVAYGTFYGYFDSKEAVFQEVAREVVGEIFEASRVRGAPTESPVAGIELANRLFLEAWSKNRRILAILDQVATFNDYFRELWRDIRRLFVERAERGIARLQADGLADPDLDAHVAGAALGGMVENFARAWLLHGEPFDGEVALATLTRLWAKGIGLDVGSRAGQGQGSSFG